MLRQSDLFAQAPAVIGMIHLAALPGTPAARSTPAEIAERAAREAAILARAGVDGVIIENMHDAPYLNSAVGPEIVAAMTTAGLAVRRTAPFPLGVQVLAGANHAALAVALACEADFIRVENFVFSHVADEGLMPVAAAGPLLRYRRAIGAAHIRIAADIKKKHASHALTADTSLIETARAARFFGADFTIITGGRTGAPADVEAVRAAAEAGVGPVWVGSGVNAGNLEEYFPFVRALIVGSDFKHDGDWRNDVDGARVNAFMKQVRRLRSGQPEVGGGGP